MSESAPAVTFSFGQNWEQYIRACFSEERVRISQKHLLGFLRRPDLKGQYFLDVGCGSGIHSLAAMLSGAERVVSFDVDPASVRATQLVHEHAGRPANWHIQPGSVLDPAFLATIEPADVVYSWGVLHHTGRMWEAIRNAARLVRPGGLFYIGLYTRSHRSPYWTRVKQKYNRRSRLGKRYMEVKYACINVAVLCLRMRNPLTTLLNYKSNRGMSYWTDIRDWLGGFPFEYASPGEAVRFGVDELGMRLVNIEAGEGAAAISEYLFERPA